MKAIVIVLCLVTLGVSGYAQKVDLLASDTQMEEVNANYKKSDYKGIKSLRVEPSAAKTEARFIALKSVDFKDGIIEVDVVGKRAESAGAMARGFVGVAFHVNEDNSKFECFYIRPTNGRAKDQMRRNHSVQYISYPDYPWHKLRKETPGKYETYADLQEGVWTKLKIKVKGSKAVLYVNGVEQATLIVNDLKHGEKAGKIGLWVGPGTEAYFANLKLTNQ
ncbi:family 16 glycoside hydrolase [Marinifilum caeruleilacunae]|uniref:DUF1080 domain-containing protein n=1 Tax=Marinifilum caeruleilacunae TaxID=2499076 RepID=A0ABX1WUV3_9BACT|nr:family 16 glycoside hydrolase [Marinifilum caeruleilacunae]NOU59837.1 DUF1080 domain-containing protein [Marinifilum caeruleilacunae]